MFDPDSACVLSKNNVKNPVHTFNPPMPANRIVSERPKGIFRTFDDALVKLSLADCWMLHTARTSALLAKLLFDQPHGLEIVSVELTDCGYQIRVKTSDGHARCTSCDAPSTRVHSRYTRTLRDLAIAGQPLVLRVQVRRLRCENTHCLKRIFSESISHIAARFQRATGRALTAQQNIALALGGEAGSRLALCLGLPVSGDSLLRRLTNIQPATASAPRVIGVDDWAIRRGQTYGTLICDLERKCPIAMLPNRSAETLTEWLKAHPEIEIISRDRAGEYAKAANDGAPQAIQVADRWHLLRNSTEALQKVIEPKQKEINVAIANLATPVQADMMRQCEASPAATESIQVVDPMNAGVSWFSGTWNF